MVKKYVYIFIPPTCMYIIVLLIYYRVIKEKIEYSSLKIDKTFSLWNTKAN